MSSICPYCSNELAKTPQRKSKCPHCGNIIFVKRKPDEDEKKLVTENQAGEIETLWAKHYAQTLEQKLKWLDVTDGRIAKVTEELRLKFGGMPRENDIIWRIYIEELIKAKDYQDRRIMYFYMAKLLNEEKKDSRKTIEYMHQCELYEWKQFDFHKRVRVYAYSFELCEACKEIDGITMDIDEALKNPLLPYC